VTDEESQRDEMNAAIRAQRERKAVPRSMLPPDEELPPRVRRQRDELSRLSGGS